MKIKMQFSPVELEISDDEITETLQSHLESAIDGAVRLGCHTYYHKQAEGDSFPKIVSMVEKALEDIDDSKLLSAVKKRLTTKLTTGIVKAIAEK